MRRGLYALAPPFRKIKAHPFLVANRLVQPSYVSLQSALAYYGLIPEYVAITMSVTTRRPGRWDTPLGGYAFRHVKIELFRDYGSLEVGDGQQAFVASAEKALLDLVHLEPGGDSRDYLDGLRLQNLEKLDLDRLGHQAELTGSPKLRRAATRVVALARSERMGYETL